MEAIKTVLLLLMTLFVLTSSEDNNFNYEDHGANWPQSCTDPEILNQSPIVLPKLATSEKTSYLFADFRSAKGHAQVLNTTIFINTEDLQKVWFGELYTQIITGTHNTLKAIEIRIRTRSQHRIGDKDGYKDLEVQPKDKVMVGLLFEAQQEYPEDPFLNEVIKGYNNAEIGVGVNDEFDLNVNLDHLLSREQIFNFWFYKGSFTMPPCSQKIIHWIIPDKVYKMSVQQRDFFKNLYSPNGNWRDVQSTEGNQIGYAQALPVPAQAEL